MDVVRCVVELDRSPASADPGQTTWVWGYHRSDGTYVRGHHRRINRPVAMAAGGGGVILFILLLLALLGRGGAGSANIPSPHPTSPASMSGHLSHQ
jgi:hypothetical protein